MSAAAPAAPGGTAGAPLGATGLVLAGVGSVQFGAALAATLFDELGPSGTVAVRLAAAALILLAFWRPRIAGRPRTDLRLALVFGLVLGGMNLSFYASIDRIPLGTAVTLEFIGPLGVAVAGSRRRLDAVWVALAAAGILLLGGGLGGSIDPLGAALALLAGAFWAAYILLSARIGQVFPGGRGLAIAMAIGAVAVAPVGIADAGHALLDPRLLLLGAIVGVMSSVIPYSLELEALRRMPARVFGVLMSTEPAVAALAGALILAQHLGLREWLAIALVVAASAGATLSARGTPPPPVDA